MTTKTTEAKLMEAGRLVGACFGDASRAHAFAVEARKRCNALGVNFDVNAG